jgi:hypothetical protein
MKNAKIRLSSLQAETIDLPLGKELVAIKVSPQQVAEFDGSVLKTRDDVLSMYGTDNMLREGEYYKGYLVVYYMDGYVELVMMSGTMVRVSSQYADCVIGFLSDYIKEGMLWKCTGSKRNNFSAEGYFARVSFVTNLDFYRFVCDAQKNGDDRYLNIDAKAIDVSIKAKLTNALLTEDPNVEFEDVEDMILHECLKDYYLLYFDSSN